MMHKVKVGQSGTSNAVSYFYSDGKMVMAESDEDGDGNWDSLVVYGQESDSFEVFRRNTQGQATPVKYEEMLKLREEKANFRELFTHQRVGPIIEESSPSPKQQLPSVGVN